MNKQEQIILKDFEYFLNEFKHLKSELNKNKEITISIYYDKEFNYFSYDLIGLFNCLEKDIIFSTTNETELNKIMKYLLNKNYFINFDIVY